MSQPIFSHSVSFNLFQLLSIGECDTDHELFPEFLRRLETSLTAASAQPALQAEALVCLEQCLTGGSAKAALSHWRQMYRTYLPSSGRLLQHLGEYLNTLHSALRSGWALVFPSLIKLVTQVRIPQWAGAFFNRLLLSFFSSVLNQEHHGRTSLSVKAIWKWRHRCA